MSSQAREKSALKIDLQICVIPLATTVALFFWVLCYFGCSCIYVQLSCNMKYVQLLCNMQLEYVTLSFFEDFPFGTLQKKFMLGDSP